ncbi:DSPc-domain-containing protein [Cytidiella melzeri]|nr:DSPc-domain-containing protein [Cytidiella melzeri]
MIRFDNIPPEVMQAMCTPMHLILPPSASPAPRSGALYLGSLQAIFDAQLLASHSIGALVQVLDAPWLPSVDAHGPGKMESYRLDILDSTTADLKPHLEATVRWIDERLRKGVNVLVHCQQQGISRSSAVVIAYLIYTHNMTYDAAFDLVKRKRACVKPNSGFVKCLQEWERQWHPLNKPVIRRAQTTPR